MKIIYVPVPVDKKKPNVPKPKPKYQKEPKYPKKPKIPMPVSVPSYPKKPKISLIDMENQIPILRKESPKFIDKLKPQNPFFGNVKPIDPLAGIKPENPTFPINSPNYGGLIGNGFGLPGNKVKGYPGVGLDNSNIFSGFFTSYGNDELVSTFRNRVNDENQSVSLMRSRLLPRSCQHNISNHTKNSNRNKLLSKLGLQKFLYHAKSSDMC